MDHRGWRERAWFPRPVIGDDDWPREVDRAMEHLRAYLERKLPDYLALHLLEDLDQVQEQLNRTR